ncbi:MAG: hypothetical protein GKR87_13500 [Kiritimatiellae bacterium]|nr:hypothetical protein [Kiritimatiellia bacterium]
MPEEKKAQRRITHIVGLGLDECHGHIRMIQGKNFNVQMGSERSHEQMQKICMKINERLDAVDKKLEDLSENEFIELLTDIDG